MLTRTRKIILISLVGLAAPWLLLPVLWATWYFIFYIGYGNFKNWGHQEFAVNGVAQIEPASQMDHLFNDCRHYITYSGHESVPTWNSVAFFGGRYELCMQVPVKIESSTSGRMIGEPRFYLYEVDRVSASPSGQIGASFSNQFEFGLAEWKAIVEADGDFGAIGINVKTALPVEHFDAYINAVR